MQNQGWEQCNAWVAAFWHHQTSKGGSMTTPNTTDCKMRIEIDAMENCESDDDP